MAKVELSELHESQYLGDGLYVGHDNYQIWLVAHNGLETTDAVALDPDVQDALFLYIKKLKEMRGGTRR